MKIGDNVKYNKLLKGLDFGEIGVISSIHETNENNKKDWIVIVYKQNMGKNKVYAHSANKEDVENCNVPVTQW